MSDVWHPSPGFLALALIVAIGAALAWLLWPPPTPGTGNAPAMAASPPAARTTVAAPAARPQTKPAPVAVAPVQTTVAVKPPEIQRERDPNGDLTPDLADFVNAGERPTMAEVIERMHAAGVTSGLGAFSPPGTRPPLVGLAVPEDFELPPGYVRHYQATDDGQRIEPILMFSPDLRLYDSAGQAVPLPADRVVRPELAPPGLPIRRIVIPAPVDAGK